MGTTDQTPLTAPAVDIVIPAHDEEADLPRSVRRLHAYLRHSFPVSARITIVDNASTDGTWAEARALEAELAGVRARHLPAKGRGGAIATAWLDSDTAVLAYMDVDLSTDLDALLPLVAPLLSGHSDVSIGSRLAPGARVRRGPKREIISRCYNLLLKLVLGVRFRDAQCGFKAIRADAAHLLLPYVEDRRWFFDTELLVLAEWAGFRIHEVPVDWTDDPDSRVQIVSTAFEDLMGIARVWWSLVSGRAVAGLHGRLVPAPERRGLLRRAAGLGLAGLLSTVAYALLCLALLRAGLPAPAANTAALLVTAVARTAAGRSVTLGVGGRGSRAAGHAGGVLAFGLAVLTTNLALAVLRVADPGAPLAVELAALTIAGAAASVTRFQQVRDVIFNRRLRPGPRPLAEPTIGSSSSTG